MYFHRFAPAGAALVLLAACTQPLDTVIPSNQSEWDSKLAPAVQKLNTQDRADFIAYMARHVLGATFGAVFGQDPKAAAIPFGTTIGQAIQQQRTWTAQQQAERARAAAEEKQKAEATAALKEKAEASAEAARQAMRAAVTVALMDKTFKPHDFSAGRASDMQYFTVAIENTSDKTIAGIAGTLKFIDLFNANVGDVTFKVAHVIAPGATYTWNGERRYNEFIAEQRAVRDLESGQYKTRFVAKSIVFADGTRLGTAE
ncbi:MAG: hypothetical protein EPN34_00815 [Burkholderiaceae bacterium]|jgi:hypothetical protein|nr:MAG: hypothetical protein EPN34_00815 [Burkholderiaceae bacterium]